MASEIYFNIDDGHFKIWGYDMFRGEKETTIITYYGIIGKPMYKLRKNKKVFSSWSSAYDYVWDKIKEKTNFHGYYSMPNGQYFSCIDNNSPISQLVGLMECYKREQN